MKPSEKSSEIERQLDNFTKTHFGRGRIDSIENNICVTCGKDAKEFRDELSRKEYSISGMCQECQDKTFTPPGESEE